MLFTWIKNLFSNPPTPHIPENLESRVVRVDKEFFLQIRFSPNDPWEFACGYHCGAEGPFNYQFKVAYNPWALVDHFLPAIIAELRRPTLPPDNIARAKKMKPRDPPAFDEIYSTAALLADTYRPWHNVTPPVEQSP